MACKFYALQQGEIKNNARRDSIRADYQIGNALYDKGEYDEAERYWTRALHIFTKENETHPTTTAAKLKLSCIDMKRGNFGEAM